MIIFLSSGSRTRGRMNKLIVSKANVIPGHSDTDRLESIRLCRHKILTRVVSGLDAVPIKSVDNIEDKTSLRINLSMHKKNTNFLINLLSCEFVVRVVIPL